MRDVRRYWQEIREAEAALPEFVWLTSALESEPPFATEVPAAIAARLLHAKTHRLATGVEVEVHRRREAAAHRAAREAQHRRAGTAVVGVTQAASSKPDRKTRR